MCRACVQWVAISTVRQTSPTCFRMGRVWGKCFLGHMLCGSCVEPVGFSIIAQKIQTLTKVGAGIGSVRVWRWGDFECCDAEFVESWRMSVKVFSPLEWTVCQKKLRMTEAWMGFAIWGFLYCLEQAPWRVWLVPMEAQLGWGWNLDQDSGVILY